MIWNYYHFKRRNTEFTRNHETLKNSYLFKNDKEKKSHVLGKNIKIYYKKLQKK
jgi:hypothetical protein